MPTITIIVLSVAGLMLTGAGILINKIWRDSETNNMHMRESLLQLNTQTYDSLWKLNNEISRLSATVTGLNATVMAQADDTSGFKLYCKEHRNNTETRLKAHGLQLDKHETEIAVIKEKIKK